MNLATIHTEDRRGIILSALKEDPDGQLNERSIRSVLRHYGHAIDADLVRQLLDWLKQAGLVTVTMVEGGDGLWLAHLTDSGLDVAGGRRHAGVRPFGRS